jgi:gliding motility-associated-like protein
VLNTLISLPGDGIRKKITYIYNLATENVIWMKNKFLYVIIFLFLLPLISSASHIIGGSITYEQINGNTYRINLTLYRDCTIGTNEPFPANAKINIVKSNGAPFKTVAIPFSSATVISSQIDTCVANPGICVQEGIYSQVVTGLPPSTGGYHVYFQLCCRTIALLNINTPTSTGETFYAHIPDYNVTTNNNSPKWVNSPQYFICQGNAISIGHSAYDSDGDSLYYSLYAPYDSNTVTFPGGVFTAVSIPWKSTYSATNPFNASVPNSLKISSTGLITGSAPLTSGTFAYGVRCQEYRSGIKLGEILRDFQITVVPCPPKILASFTYTGNCTGTKVSFTTLTTKANSYYWDFGNTATLADTSRTKNTTYTYAALGKYKVMLIINKGTPCADTSIQFVQVTSLKAAFTSSAPVCQKTVVNFTDISTIDANNTITGWSWTFGDGNSSLLKSPKNTYLNSGNYNVTLIISASGCKDTIAHAVSIQASSDARAGNDTTRCANNPSVTLKGTVINAGGGSWKGNGTFVPNNNVLNPTYTATPTAIKNGADTLLLISTNNALCPADTDTVIIHFTKTPTVNAGKDLVVCKDTVSISVCATVTIASGVTWKSTGTGKFITDSTKSCTSYKPSKADTTAGSVILYATTTGNGNCLAVADSLLITFTATIKVNITSRDTACMNSPIPISVMVTTNSGIWTSSGTGIFKPTATALTGNYFPSKTDSINGSVRLIFTSGNNGNCLTRRDTVTVSIIPSPSADFTSVAACEGKPAVFTDNSQSIVQLSKWKWNFGDASAIDTLKNPVHIYIKGGPYPVMLIVSSKNGCADTAKQTITINYNPIANFNTSGICLNEGIQFTDSSFVTADNMVKWKWFFGDAKTDSLKNPIHHYSASGTYKNLLVVTSSHQCIDSVEKTLKIEQGPAAHFIADAANNHATVKQTIHFTDQSNQAIAWHWNFGDGSSDSVSVLQNPTHAYDLIGHFNVCLYVTDKNGCVDTICLIEKISLPVGVPNAFSPNGDGQNDLFSIYGGPFTEVHLKIYNNWGELIFETDKPEGWDGRVKGIEQPAGVYVFTLYCVSEDTEKHKLSGDVTLLR